MESYVNPIVLKTSRIIMDDNWKGHEMVWLVLHTPDEN